MRRHAVSVPSPASVAAGAAASTAPASPSAWPSTSWFIVGPGWRCTTAVPMSRATAWLPAACWSSISAFGPSCVGRLSAGPLPVTRAAVVAPSARSAVMAGRGLGRRVRSGSRRASWLMLPTIFARRRTGARTLGAPRLPEQADLAGTAPSPVAAGRVARVSHGVPALSVHGRKVDATGSCGSLMARWRRRAYGSGGWWAVGSLDQGPPIHRTLNCRRQSRSHPGRPFPPERTRRAHEGRRTEARCHRTPGRRNANDSTSTSRRASSMPAAPRTGPRRSLPGRSTRSVPRKVRRKRPADALTRADNRELTAPPQIGAHVSPAPALTMGRSQILRAPFRASTPAMPLRASAAACMTRPRRGSDDDASPRSYWRIPVRSRVIRLIAIAAVAVATLGACAPVVTASSALAVPGASDTTKP